MTDFFDHVERELLGALRAEGAPEGRPEPSAAPGIAARGGKLRGRWRRLGRGGHIAGVLAGGLVLGAVATGSAQVVGLDPWGKLTGQDRIDPQLRPVSGAVGVRAPAVPGRAAWELRAYVARNGKVCVVGGGKGGEGLYDCRTSDRAAALLAGRSETGNPLAGAVYPGPLEMAPGRMLVWALTAWDAPPVVFRGPASSRVEAMTASRPLQVPVDHTEAGLSSRGRAVLATLPRAITLRLSVAEISGREPITRGGDPLAVPSGPHAGPGPLTVELTSHAAWEKAHAGRRWTVSDDGTFERSPAPVGGSTEGQRRDFPSLARPRTKSDALPAGAITATLRDGRIQRREARRLRVSGEGDLGPVWLAPGALRPETTVPTIDGQVCLAGPRVLSHCQPTQAQASLPAPEAVLCSPGLPRDRFLTWSFVPAAADRVRVVYADGATASYEAGDLLILLRPRSASLPTSIEWSGPNGFSSVEKGPFPADATTKRCGTGQERYWDLRRSRDASGESHRD